MDEEISEVKAIKEDIELDMLTNEGSPPGTYNGAESPPGTLDGDDDGPLELFHDNKGEDFDVNSRK